VKFTQYFHAMRQRPDRAIIQEKWIQHVIDHPEKEVFNKMAGFAAGHPLRKWA